MTHTHDNGTTHDHDAGTTVHTHPAEYRYGYGDSGHPFDPDRNGRCHWAGSGYCDGTPTDPSHEKRPAVAPSDPDEQKIKAPRLYGPIVEVDIHGEPVALAEVA